MKTPEHLNYKPLTAEEWRHIKMFCIMATNSIGKPLTIPKEVLQAFSRISTKNEGTKNE